MDRILFLAITESYAIFAACEQTGTIPAIVNDTGRDFRARYLYVWFPTFDWGYCAFEGLPFLSGIGIEVDMNLEECKPILVQAIEEGDIRKESLAKLISARQGFIIPIEEILSLIEEGNLPSWQREDNFLVNEELGIAMPLETWPVVRGVQEIRDLLEHSLGLRPALKLLKLPSV